MDEKDWIAVGEQLRCARIAFGISLRPDFRAEADAIARILDIRTEDLTHQQCMAAYAIAAETAIVTMEREKGVAAKEKAG